MKAVYAGYVVAIADIVSEQSVPDLPGEDRRTFALVLRNAVDHVRRRYAGFAAADRARSDRPALVVATEYLADAAI